MPRLPSGRSRRPSPAGCREPPAPRWSCSARAGSFEDLEGSLPGNSAFAPALDALNQLRVIASLGLGINFTSDLLPLFDGEAAVALDSLDTDGFHGQVLLRPSEAAAAEASLERMRSALAGRGSTVRTREAAGTTITSVEVPQVGSVTYAVQDGVVILGLDAADVAAALEAHAGGETLATDERYGAPFLEVTGASAGNELWADVATLVTRWPPASTREANFAISSTRSASLQSAQPPPTASWRSTVC